jgi:hypothetical protein
VAKGTAWQEHYWAAAAGVCTVAAAAGTGGQGRCNPQTRAVL